MCINPFSIILLPFRACQFDYRYDHFDCHAYFMLFAHCPYQIFRAYSNQNRYNISIFMSLFWLDAMAWVATERDAH